MLIQRASQSTLGVIVPEMKDHPILRGVERNERRVLVGPDAWWLDKLVRLFGSAYQGLLVRGMRRDRARQTSG